jgi:hypothetical protein
VRVGTEEFYDYSVSLECRGTEKISRDIAQYFEIL